MRAAFEHAHGGGDVPRGFRIIAPQSDVRVIGTVEYRQKRFLVSSNDVRQSISKGQWLLEEAWSAQDVWAIIERILRASGACNGFTLAMRAQHNFESGLLLDKGIVPTVQALRRAAAARRKRCELEEWSQRVCRTAVEQDRHVGAVLAKISTNLSADERPTPREPLITKPTIRLIGQRM
jgi:hypothetical protein